MSDQRSPTAIRTCAVRGAMGAHRRTPTSQKRRRMMAHRLAGKSKRQLACRKVFPADSVGHRDRGVPTCVPGATVPTDAGPFFSKALGPSD